MNFSGNISRFSPTQKEFSRAVDFLEIWEQPWVIEQNFYKKTYKYLKFISWIPGIKMIGIWNTIAMNSAKKSSDIDLYIVTSPGKMWTVRILITFIFQLLWVRKNDKHHAGRFCLSFFSTTDALDFWKFALENDIYLYFWILYFKPVLDINNTYEKFISANNSWADFSWREKIIAENKKYIKISKNISEKNISKIWIFIENILKKIFLPKTLKHYEKIWKPYGIIISDDILKFHNGDIRKKVRNKIL